MCKICDNQFERIEIRGDYTCDICAEDWHDDLWTPVVDTGRIEIRDGKLVHVLRVVHRGYKCPYCHEVFHKFTSPCHSGSTGAAAELFASLTVDDE